MNSIQGGTPTPAFFISISNPKLGMKKSWFFIKASSPEPLR
jgi:hypothetical protein